MTFKPCSPFYAITCLNNFWSVPSGIRTPECPHAGQTLLLVSVSSVSSLSYTFNGTKWSGPLGETFRIRGPVSLQVKIPPFLKVMKHRAKPFHVQWWRIHMHEKFPNRTWNYISVINQISILLIIFSWNIFFFKLIYQVHECQSISNEMKDMILNNVKQRQLVEKIMKKYSFGWEPETSWLTR